MNTMAVSTNPQQISLGEFSRSALLFLNESLNTYLLTNNSIASIPTQYSSLSSSSSHSSLSNQTHHMNSSVSAANLTGSAERTPGNDGFAIVFLWSALFYPMVVTAAAGN